MQIKSGRMEGFEKWMLDVGVESPAFVERVHIIADQIEAWMLEDGLTESMAFSRMLRDRPELSDTSLESSVDVIAALNNFWEYGEHFKAFIEAENKSLNTDQPN